MQQLGLFNDQRLPRRPYCTDDMQFGLSIRDLDDALKRKYLQFNPPHALYWIVLDIDAPVVTPSGEKPSRQMLAILDGKIPSPNFMAVNPVNGHAHAFYGLETPVAKGEHASAKALRYAAAIESALIFGLGADACYTGLVAKNPCNRAWRLVTFREDPYTLSELHDSLNLQGPSKSKLRREAIENGLGRNCELFDRLRFHAYSMAEIYKEDASFELWQRYIEGKAIEYNCFASPLDVREVKHIANSVSKWVWTHYTGRMSAEAFSKRQSARGAKGGRISAKTRMAQAGTPEAFSEQMKTIRAQKASSSDERGEKIRKLYEEKVSVTEISRLVGVSRPTVYKHLKSVK